MTYIINPNAKNVWIRDNEDTMDLSPITDASSVYLENGRTLEQELGEGSMVSNVATVDNSMNKIIDGTLDGAYESGVMYGKSLVNLVSNHKIKIANGTTNLFPMIIPMDAKKKYLISFKIDTAHTSTGEPNQSAIKLQYYAHNNNKGYNFIYNSELADGREFKFIVEPFSGEVSQDTNFFAIWLTRYESGTLHGKLSVFEYVDGMENWDIPYFEGICDVKMPILRNVGKNLLTREYTLNSATLVEETNEYVMTKGSGNIAGGLVFAPNLIPNKTYSFSVTAKTNKTADGAIRVYNDTRKEYINVYLAGLTTQAQKVGGVFTVPTTHQIGDEFKIWIGKNTDYDLETTFTIYKDWQLEESSSITTHEDHKSNILHTPEIVTLRSLPNGVRDELNLKTGEYTQRIGEVVLDGSENNWITIFNYNETDDYSTFKLDTALPNGKTVTYPLDAYIVDKMQNQQLLSKPMEFVHINSQPRVCIKLLQTRLSEQTATGLKAWLQQNPVTVQYELQTPITTKVALTQSEPIVKIGTELPNGVCDTYNLLTGEHIQRVGKVVLDGSEAWTKVAFPSTNTTHCYSSLKIENLKMPNVNEKNIVSDRFQTVPQESYNYSNEEMYTWRDGELLYVSILRSRLSTSDVQGLKAWFKENPTTVWYELKNPIVTKKNGLPNTHGVTLPSGVVDKYNESTGVYTQNVGVEYVGDNGAFDNIIQQSNGTRIHYNLGESIRPIKTKVLTDDRFTFKDTWSETYEPYSVFIGSGLDMYFVIPTSEGVTTIAQAKDWFEANKTLLYYELATPKTIDIPLINVGQVLPNGVCDTYNPITKEYVKRLESIVLNGDEAWEVSPNQTLPSGYVSYLINSLSIGGKSGIENNYQVCDKLPYGVWEAASISSESEFTSNSSSTKHQINFKMKASRLEENSVDGFKAWLNKSPVTVWYELATPEVSTVDLDLSTLYSSSPVAYENGHIILESGHDGQSLLPTLEYSTVTNRVKQIENIGEQVLRQEKQLTMLEQMLIQNIIGMDYNNTLLTLNLEIDEVM